MLTKKSVKSNFAPAVVIVYLIAGHHTPIESELQQKGPFKNVNQIISSLG